MSEAIALLENILATALEDGFRRTAISPDTTAMTRLVAKLNKQFDSPVPVVQQDRVAAAIAAFRKTGQIKDFLSLRLVCFGVCDPRNGLFLVAEPALLSPLLAKVEAGNQQQQLRCFQGLLRSYFAFPREEEQTPDAARDGWSVLRKWLLSRFEMLKSAGAELTRMHSWFNVLRKHNNLLTEDPCGIYSRSLFEGDSSALQEARAGLAIPLESWVFQEAIFAQVHHLLKLSDASFQSSIDRVLILVFGKSELNVSKRVTRRSVALLVSRYARCVNRPQNIPLRDAALEAIGNPWLRRQAWDAYVVDKLNRPDAEAREMILHWLREQLIKDFFELLTEDRAADPRRLNYWLRFEPAIQDMWFVLGRQAATSTERDYVEFRKRALGRVRRLAGQTAQDNNAFVMRIGDRVVIDFGKSGNACRLRTWDQLPPLLVKKLMSGADYQEIEIELLRGHDEDERLTHSPKAGESWEQKFDGQVIPAVGYRPRQAPYFLVGERLLATRRPLSPFGRNQAKPVFHPTPAPKTEKKTNPIPSSALTDLDALVGKHRYRVEDLRPRGGYYWIFIDNGDFEFARKLRSLGFQYKIEKGWWKS